MIEESDNESDKESDKEPNKKSDNESNKESDNKNTANWYNTNKFNKILTAIDSNSFNHKYKICKLKFNDINNSINNIKSNTISEADTKKKINELNEIKKVETKGKWLIKNQKKLLSLFDDLKQFLIIIIKIMRMRTRMRMRMRMRMMMNNAMK